MPVVVAPITPLPHHRDAARDALRAAVAQVHAEQGCELYALHEAPDRFVMVERWASVDALRAHSTGAGVTALNAALDGKLASPTEVVVLEAVPVGDPGKGVVGHG
jgi:quinol monooxygenase YgiN